MPGRSTMVISRSPRCAVPSFFSTVTPGQLPTYWFEPVRALKRVVLPQLGLPTSATRMVRLSCSVGSAVGACSLSSCS